MPSPELILGVPLMDSDHAQLELLLKKVDGTEDSALPAFLFDIETEMRAHFQREEDLMRSRRVAILSCHLVQHDLLLAEFACAHEAARLNDMPRLRHFLSSTLLRRLSDHINTVDRITAEFLHSCADADWLGDKVRREAPSCQSIRI